jgi:CheY-like chemotaxis protein
MQCPRCHGPITAPPDPGGQMICPGCGARLLSRAAKPKAVDPEPPNPGGGSGVTGGVTGSFADMESHPPEETLPPPRPRRPGEDTKPSIGRSPAPVAPPDEAPAAGPASPPSGAFEEILAELRSLREAQDEILALLRARPGVEQPPEVAGATSAFEGFHETAEAPAVRTRRRKTVLLIDDDPETRQAALAALEQAEVPSRGAPDGNAGLEAIAEEKPDVIVLELALIGDMAGKDVINMIKATMEWVDIPIVLYTRAPVESQKEARTIHGADEVVPKQSGPQALVTRIISVFRSR